MKELAPPARHGEVLCVPEFPRWREVAEEAARRAAEVEVHGQPLASWRAQARAEVAERAAALLRRWGDPVPEASGPLWVATGHQPTLFHPGIWIKTWAMNACAAQGTVGLNLVVDSDECGRWGARVPRRNGRLQVAERTLVWCGREVPFEAAPPPHPARWQAFCAELRADLATLDRPAVVQRLHAAEEAGLRSLEVARNLGEFGAGLRRRLEARSGPVRYLELSVSELSRTRAFRLFAAWVAQDAERFWACYNEALDRHRREAGVRSASQPFPDLRRDGEQVELPFWVLQDGVRHPVFVRPGHRPLLVCGGRPVGELPDRVPEGLRPRALALTLFVRLLVCDLFVHGLGGARYDRVTDRVLQEFFGFSPPPFAVLTATFHLPLSRHADPRAAYAEAHRLWVDLQHNPDRYLPRDGEADALVQEKWRCIRELQSPQLSRRSRRELTHRIRAVNEALRTYVQDRLAAVEAELAALREEVAEQEVATDRTYPFFLFDPEEVQAPLRLAEGVRCG